VNAQLEFVRDINTRSSQAEDPEDFIAYGSAYLFTLNDQVTGRELWISDGTVAGSRLVKDINKKGDGFNGHSPCFTFLGGIAYFFADDDTHGTELWRSDGTADGTWLVKDVRPGNLDGVGEELIAVGGKLFFTGRTDGQGRELWVSDGTALGTRLVMDILPGGGSSNPRHLIAFNGDVLFEANNGTHGYELWRSDGEENGQTERLTDLNLNGSANLSTLTVSGNKLFFMANTGDGNVLHQMNTDLTITAIGAFADDTGYLSEMVSFGDGRVLISFMDNTTWGTEAWVTDGSTHTLLPIANGGGSHVANLYASNGLVYFSADDGSTGSEPYRTDGTVEGTFLIADVNSGDGSYPRSFAWGGDHIYFIADDGVHGEEVWKTTGELGSASMVADLAAGVSSSYITQLTGGTGGVAFATDDAAASAILPCFSDGSAEGTNTLLLHGPSTRSSDILAFTQVNGVTVFIADDGVHGRELWATDGTTIGTALVEDIFQGEEPGVLDTDGRVFNGVYYFRGQPENEGSELCRSDGTTDGTDVMTVIAPGPTGGCYGGFFELGGWLYFTGNTTPTGREMMRTDGTEDNTGLFFDAIPGPAGSDMRLSATLGDMAVLNSINTSGQRVLWSTDGTIAGTIELATFSSTPLISIGAAQGQYFFTACTPWPCQVWHTDGTVEGTEPCSFLAQFGSSVRWITPFATGAVLFVDQDQGGGKGYFYWDGATTVTSLYDGSTFPSTIEQGHVVHEGKVVSITLTPNGYGLVTMDPLTLAVTVVDLHPGAGSGSYGPITIHDGAYYFMAPDMNGEEALWRSDGTTDGTYAVTGAGELYAITALHSTEGGLLIAAAAPGHGSELFRYRPQGRLAVRALLQGAYDPGSGLLRDALRASTLIPSLEPYTELGLTAPGEGGQVIHASALDVTGNDAVVDWVLIELRDPAQPEIILATRPALLQRDGDVVGTDGRSPVTIGEQNGTYRIALRHRNHLGAMAQDPVTLDATQKTVDLSDPATLKHGSEATTHIDGHDMLWAGNVAVDDMVKYTGAQNDRDPILTTIGGLVPTNSVTGYHLADVNLDGTVKYTGSNNDRDIILQVVGGSVPTNTRIQRLP